MNTYFTAALAPSTRSTYRSGLNRYLDFCKCTYAIPFPLVKIALQLFVTSIAGHVKFSTIKVYRCGIQYQGIVLGFSKKISSMPKLYYIMCGIRRSHPNNVTRRLPITPLHLREMVKYTNNCLFSHNDKFDTSSIFWVITCVRIYLSIKE